MRDPTGSEALNTNNLMCRAVRAISARCLGSGVICDAALDPYTSHGHDGVMDGERTFNDASVQILVQQAQALADAGADVIAPSDMMDGRVGTIRATLDGDGHGRADHGLCSEVRLRLLRPFRDAIGTNATLVGDKRTYQMDPANSDEAIAEVMLDLEEGADMVMIKPGLPYLDVVARVKDHFRVPTFTTRSPASTR